MASLDHRGAQMRGGPGVEVGDSGPASWRRRGRAKDEQACAWGCWGGSSWSKASGEGKTPCCLEH